MDCLKCKNNINVKDQFCPNCGKKLDKEKSFFEITYKIQKRISSYLSSFPLLIMPITDIIDEDGSYLIQQIIIDTCKRGASSAILKSLMIAGYLARKFEGETFKPIKERFRFNNDLQALLKKNHDFKGKLKSLANHLDESKVIGAGPNLKQFLILNEDELYVLLEEVFNLTLNYFGDVARRFLATEEGEEVIKRNFFFGYCLRVSKEILYQIP